MQDAQKSVVRLAAPLMVSFVLRSLFTLVDTFFAARLGDAAVAAIGLTIPLEIVFIAAWVGSSNALTALLGEAMGAGDGQRIRAWIGLGYRLVGLLAPAFVVLGFGCWYFAPRLGLEAPLARAFGIYAGLLVGGTGLTGFWSIVPDSIVKMHHDTRSTMIAGLWSNVTNVTLNTLFLFVFGWGIAGIALSTVLGRLAGLSYALLRARALEEARERSWSEQAAATPPEAGAGAPSLRRLLTLAFPSGLGTLLMAAQTGIANALLARLPYEATASVAAFGIFTRFVHLGRMPLVASAVAMLPFVARHYGARRWDLIRRGVIEMTLLGIGLVVAAAPLYALGAPRIARWLTETPAAYEQALWALRFCPLMIAASVPYFVFRPVFEGMQRMGPSLFVAALRHVALAAPLGWWGVTAALRIGKPALYGLLVGFAVAAAISSAVIAWWGRRILRSSASKRMVATRCGIETTAGAR